MRPHACRRCKIIPLGQPLVSHKTRCICDSQDSDEEALREEEAEVARLEALKAGGLTAADFGLSSEEGGESGEKNKSTRCFFFDYAVSSVW